MAKLVYTCLQDDPRERYFATSGALIVGRIDCICAGPQPAEQWMWGMQLDIGAAPFRRGATVGSRDEAVEALGQAWEDWKVWAGLRDMEALHVAEPGIVEPAVKALR